MPRVTIVEPDLTEEEQQEYLKALSETMEKLILDTYNISMKIEIERR